MADDAMLKMETRPSAKTRTVGTRLSSRGFAPSSLRHLIPDVSLRTGTGLTTLAAAALVDVATTMGAIWMAAGPDKAPFFAANIFSLCRPSFRGENYVDVLDGKTYDEKTRIILSNGPGMTIFSPDGKYGYVCSSFNPETDVITVADHKIVGRVPQASPFYPNIAATPDGSQVWIDAHPPFAVLKTAPRRYLVIAPGSAMQPGKAVQIQVE
jgi:DNA-binding beta-propeller fold protein YncE